MRLNFVRKNQSHAPTRQAGLTLLALACFCFVAAQPSLAQGRPDIVWMKGKHTGVTYVAYTGDGQRLITASNGLGDGTVKVRSVTKGTVLRTFYSGLKYGAVTSSSETGLIATSGYTVDGSTRVWNSEDGSLLQAVDGISIPYLSPNGNSLVGYSGRGGILYRFLSGAFSGEPVSLYGDPPFVFTRDSKTLISQRNYTPGESTFYFLDGVTGLLNHSWTVSPRETLLAVANKGDRVITVSSSEVHLRRSADGFLLKAVPRNPLNSYTYAHFSNDDRTVYLGGGQYVANTIYFLETWRLSTGTRVPLLQTPPRTGYYSPCFAISPDERRVTIGGTATDFNLDVGLLYHYRLPDGAALGEEDGLASSVRSLAVSPDGMLVAATASDNLIKLWNLQTGALVRTLTADTNVNAVAFSPDGRTLLAAIGYTDSGAYAYVWRVADGKRLQTIPGNGEVNPTGATYSPDGSKIALSFDYIMGVGLYRASDGTPLRSLSSPNGGFFEHTLFSPDRVTLATSGVNTPVTLFNILNGRLTRTVALYHDNSTSRTPFAFSPDGQILAVGDGRYGGGSNTISLVRVADGAVLQTLTGHTDSIVALAFSPDGATLLSGGADSTLRQWRVADGALLKTYDEETGNPNGYPNSNYGIMQAAFSPDGQYLVYGTYDSNVVVARNTFWTRPTLDGLFTFPAATVHGGVAARGKITLSGPAPIGGLPITLSSTGGVALPATLTVPVGARGVFFAFTTPVVTQRTSVTLTVSSGGVSRTVTLNVLP